MLLHFIRVHDNGEGPAREGIGLRDFSTSFLIAASERASERHDTTGTSPRKKTPVREKNHGTIAVQSDGVSTPICADHHVYLM